MAKSVVYNSDCLEAMRAMPDKAFDLAIVDPPYGIGYNRTGTTYTAGKGGKGFYSSTHYALKQWDAAIPSAEYFEQLFRISANQVIWGGNYFPLPLSRGWVFWDKKIANATTENYSAGELAWTSFDTVLTKFTYDWVGFGYLNSTEKGSRIHPTQKPVALYKWLLQNYAKPGDSILDTHLGSGSSRIAAYDLGFDFTGYELDKDYYEAQERRFADHIAQPKLWEPTSVPVIQGDLLAA